MTKRVGVVMVCLVSILRITQVSGAGQLRREQVTTDNPPLVTRAVAPVFSPILALMLREGHIAVLIRINHRGEVVSATVAQAKWLQPIVDSSTYVQPVLNAARRWQFAPLTDAAPDREVQLDFTFVIVPKDSKLEDCTPVFLPPYKMELRSNEDVKVGDPYIIRIP